MRASLIRTDSLPIQKPVFPCSPRVSLSRQASLPSDKNRVQSPRLSMQFNSNADSPPNDNFGVRWDLNRAGSRSFPSIIGEFLSDGDGRTALRKPRHAEIPVKEEPGFGGGGGDHGIVISTGGNGGEKIKIGAYYEEMLKLNPTDALLLRNYGKFLHEVVKDTARAEEYYGRAILANANDGELLALYGKLIWETERDEERAKYYFDQAIHVAPDDCTVLGSYAHFMWEAGEEEEEEEEEEGLVNGTVEMIAAF